MACVPFSIEYKMNSLHCVSVIMTLLFYIINSSPYGMHIASGDETCHLIKRGLLNRLETWHVAVLLMLPHYHIRTAYIHSPYPIMKIWIVMLSIRHIAHRTSVMNPWIIVCKLGRYSKMKLVCNASYKHSRNWMRKVGVTGQTLMTAVTKECSVNISMHPTVSTWLCM